MMNVEKLILNTFSVSRCRILAGKKDAIGLHPKILHYLTLPCLTYKQESRAVATKPCNTAAVLFGLKVPRQHSLQV